MTFAGGDPDALTSEARMLTHLGDDIRTDALRVVGLGKEAGGALAKTHSMTSNVLGARPSTTSSPRRTYGLQAHPRWCQWKRGCWPVPRSSPQTSESIDVTSVRCGEPWTATTVG